MNGSRMSRTVCAMSLFACGCAFAQNGTPTPDSGAWGLGEKYQRLYDAGSAATVRGKVVGIGVGSPLKGISEGVHFLVKPDKDATVIVHVGPAWYVQNQSPKIKVKDEVTVKGSRVALTGKSAIIASEIIKGDKVLALRDSKGVPVWVGWRALDDRTAPPASRTDDKAVITGGGYPGTFLVMENDMEIVPLHLATSWFMERPGRWYRLGEAFGMPGAINPINGPIILAYPPLRGPTFIVSPFVSSTPFWFGWGR